ncbi:MAG TPA: conjugal transfer protein [Acidimicrobiales bacterium]|nr:conjugal transfer protein [Acidimicrobiales bacterium]
MWTLVASGALGGLFAAVRPSTTVVQQAAHVAYSEPAGLGGVAEMAVRVWLLNEGRPAQGSKVALAVDAVATVATRRVASGYWAATVAASVRPSDAEAATVWFLEVGITDSGHGPRPVGRPAIVPAPITLAPLEPSPLTLAVPPPDDPIAATAQAFLQSLLSGEGDPTRYVSPNADIPAIEAAPFREVRLERIAVVEAEHGTRRVRVVVGGTTAEQIVFELFYELTLGERDGRWEVTAISAATTMPAPGPPKPASETRPASETATTAVASPGA